MSAPRESSVPTVAKAATATRKHQKKVSVPFSERAAYTIPESGALIGVGPTKSYEMAARGEIPTITIGGLRRVPAALFRQKFGLGEVK